MLALAVIVLLVIAALGGAWLTRDRELPVRCCQPGAWPPEDLAPKTPDDRAA